MGELTGPNIEALSEAYPEAAFLGMPGYDAAILGVSDAMNDEPRLVYSVSKILEILIAEDDTDDPDHDKHAAAREWLDYNIVGGYVGPQTPIWCWDEEL